MTAVPRVRVERSRYVFPGRWRWRCGECASVSLWYYPVPDGRVQTAAADHARTCPALRLVRLVAELEKLRDKLLEFSFAVATIGGLHSDEAVANWAVGQSVARRAAADDLDRLIKETNR